LKIEWELELEWELKKKFKGWMRVGIAIQFEFLGWIELRFELVKFFHQLLISVDYKDLVPSLTPNEINFYKVRFC